MIKTVFPNQTWRQIVATLVIIWCLLILTLVGLGVFNIQVADYVVYLAGITLVGRGMKCLFWHEKTAPPEGGLHK
jgi:small neutral amino acid transporter SnatA (MarC family)